jgi:hypothetical protein
VIRSGYRESVLAVGGRVVKAQIRAPHADAIDSSIKPPLERFADLVQRKLDARRAAVDREDACFSWLRG